MYRHIKNSVCDNDLIFVPVRKTLECGHAKLDLQVYSHRKTQTLRTSTDAGKYHPNKYLRVIL